MSVLEVVFAFVAGLVVNEMCDISPWLATKLVRWSARLRYRDSVRAEVRAEELTALINSRPGKLLKLFTSIGFAVTAVCVRFRSRSRYALGFIVATVLAAMLLPSVVFRADKAVLAALARLVRALRDGESGTELTTHIRRFVRAYQASQTEWRPRVG